MVESTMKTSKLAPLVTLNGLKPYIQRINKSIVNNDCLILGEFYANWCDPCKIVLQIINEIIGKVCWATQLTYTQYG
ncbi:hypothetical protein GQ457_04G004350 [Hibiscus cannabinus]